MPGNSPLCWCNSGDTETYLHCFFLCIKNREVAEAIARCVRSYDPNITAERMLRLQVETDEVFSLATMTILTTGLETIWANRVEKKVTTMYEMRSELESGVSIKRRSRDRKIREAGNIIQNVIDNFF